MLSWNIQNDIISCLAEFVGDRVKEHISESPHYAIIADVTDMSRIFEIYKCRAPNI